MVFLNNGGEGVTRAERAEVTASWLNDYWVGPVKVEAAQTRGRGDKDMIDGFIRQLTGAVGDETSIEKIVTKGK